MAFYERRRSKDAIIIRKRPDISRCTRHPKHRQAPGVCSLCLHEKLSKICSTSSSSSSSSSFAPMQYYNYSSGSSSSSSSLSSSSGSSMASPVHRYRFDRNALVKSRSNIAFVPRRKKREANESVKLGFWSKLISSRRGEKTRNTDVVDMSGLKYSKTARDR